MSEIEKKIKDEMANLGIEDFAKAKAKLEEIKKLKEKGRTRKAKRAATQFLEILERAR